tara:strand:+ start:253 stop:465 length:213 start_codon:yes stop_codon:yes gene_type:complete
MFMKVNRRQAFELGVLHAQGYKGARRIAAFGCACSAVLRRDFKVGEAAAANFANDDIVSMANRFGSEVNW